MQTLVNSKSIVTASLHVPLPSNWHVYKLPFATVYVAWLYLYLIKYDVWLGSSEATFVTFLSIATLHALSFLVCQWSVSAKAALTCRTVSDVRKASIIKIIPSKHRGKGALCEVKTARISVADGEVTDQIYFIFQKKKYIYDADKKRFEKLQYPSNMAHTIGFFTKSKGLQTDDSIKAAVEKYGTNRFDIPIPSFQELFKEHLVAPFFVFQLFCVALWFLDDMWYYSLFTLVMLFVFESTVVFQRLRTLREFRTMNFQPYPVLVFRKHTWTRIQADELVPGDIVSVVRPKDDSQVLPCDMLLLEGSCIVNEAMLSGESTPQLKEPTGLHGVDEIFDPVGIHKGCMMYGGTKVLQVSPLDLGFAQKTNEDGEKIDNRKWRAPDDGCVGYVIRTGFGTSQGKLVRTMIFSTEHVTANNLESLLFILFLLVFAVIAAWYVWQEGSNNPKRKRSKVLLDCILIVTSVVPPELPMELSLAVNNSLIALAKCFVFVTEPFRIPFAGKVDVAAFDKTGTLTGEDLLLQGLSGLHASASDSNSKDRRDNSLVETDLIHPDKSIPDSLTSATELPMASTLTLAAAHALVLLDDGIVGDPMEKNTLESIGWTLQQGETVVPKNTVSINDPSKKTQSRFGNLRVKIHRQYPFSSSLKRMSTLSTISGSSPSAPLPSTGNKMFVACKGAPETLKSMFKSLPLGYDEVYKMWARKGARVLALGWKWMEAKESRIKDIAREQVECDLIFGGLLVFHCPLKPDSAKAVKMLNSSSHRCIMITGDNALTACHVAREVEIVKREVLIADVRENDELSWQTTTESFTLPFDPVPSVLPAKSPLFDYDLCVTGRALDRLSESASFEVLLPRIWVYARVSPSQKEFILTKLKAAGYTTLMCGDGTNDVGALKQANVGIALLDGKPEDMEKIAIHARRRRQQQILLQRLELEEKWGMKLPPLPPDQEQMMSQLRQQRIQQAAQQQDGPQQANALPADPRQRAKMQMEAAMSMLDGAMEDEEVPKIKFGDASVAAPFTSKLSTIMSVCNIIRQGRSTLVAMMQMYKILALNSLISAYSLSVQYLAGIKQGDWQATIAGLLLTVCFFSVAKSTPLEKLSKKRPQSNIFNFYLVFSVLGQAAVHVGALMYIRLAAIEASEEMDEDIDLDAEFQPNLLNSAVYLVSLVMQIATFAINYQGHPFRESLRENKALHKSLSVVTFIAFAAASELSRDLNEYMQLVEFPEGFRSILLTTMILDLGFAWLVEYVCNLLFSDSRPKGGLLLEE